jgi:hypothetical protein
MPNETGVKPQTDVERMTWVFMYIFSMQHTVCLSLDKQEVLGRNNHWYLEKSGRWTKSENPIFLRNNLLSYDMVHKT